jgi:hypothetical protein
MVGHVDLLRFALLAGVEYLASHATDHVELDVLILGADHVKGQICRGLKLIVCHGAIDTHAHDAVFKLDNQTALNLSIIVGLEDVGVADLVCRVGLVLDQQIEWRLGDRVAIEVLTLVVLYVSKLFQLKIPILM